MEERLSRLEARVDAMAGSLERIEARLDSLEARTPSGSEASGPFVSFERTVEPPAQTGAGESLEVVPVLNLVGQICLVLCGAFFIRTLTGVGALPTELGLAVGPFYAAGWLFYADLLARRGKLRAANFYGGASVVIAYPLVWEGATTFGVLSTLGAAVALSIVWPIALGVAWRRELRDFAWVATLGALGTAFALLVSTHELVPVAAALLLLGAGTVWISYSRGWRGIWWLPALAADLLIVHMVYLVSRPYTLPEWETGLSVEAVMLLGLSLFVLYAGSFTVSTLLRKRELNSSRIAQTAIALLAGFGGAVYLTHTSGSGSSAVGAGALVLGLGYYGLAFAVSELHWGYRRNHTYCAWLAFILTLSGFYLLTSGLPVLLAWSVLSVAAAVAGSHFDRTTLFDHSAAYAVAAAFLAVDTSHGLIAFAIDTFTLPANQPWPGISTPELIVIGVATSSFMVIALAKADAERLSKSGLPALALAVVAALGASATVVLTLTHALGNPPPEANAAVVAAVRTGVIAGTVIALAAVSRLTGCVELRWLVYMLFVVGGLKLFLEDLPNGEPTTQMLAFALYGIALMLAPRLVRADREPGTVAPESQQG